MIRLKKRRLRLPCVFPSSGARVYANEFTTTTQDNTRVVSSVATHVDPIAELALAQAHNTAGRNVAATALAGGILGGATGYLVGGSAAMVNQCYSACHAQWPPKGP